MKKIEIITRQEKLLALKETLAVHKCQGMTVHSVMGCGRQKGYIEELHMTGDDIYMLNKVMVFVVVDDAHLEEILGDIVGTIGTGKAGDGKIFIYDVYDVVRIRTNERGEDAL